jgi:hypothetical protein
MKVVHDFKIIFDMYSLSYITTDKMKQIFLYYRRPDIYEEGSSR